MSEINLYQNDSELLQLIILTLGEEGFTVDIYEVKEINKVMELTKIPNIIYFVEGVVNLRGRIISLTRFRIKWD